MIEREPGQDGVMSLTFTHEQTQVPSDLVGDHLVSR